MIISCVFILIIAAFLTLGMCDAIQSRPTSTESSMRRRIRAYDRSPNAPWPWGYRKDGRPMPPRGGYIDRWGNDHPYVVEPYSWNPPPERL